MTESSSIRLEAWGTKDRPLLDALLADPVMTTHLGGPENPAKLAQRQARYEQPGSRQYKVLVDDLPAGHVGYWGREWRDEEIWESGWGVVPEFQGRGVAAAAMRSLLEVIAAEPVSRAVHAFPSVDNGPSNALCRKLGFELLGAFDFEYPPGHPLRCNDWVINPRAGGSPAASAAAEAGRWGPGASGTLRHPGLAE